MIIEGQVTPEQYLELERAAEMRHEFVDGEMRAMAGDKKRNNRVVGRLYRLLIERAEAQGCDVFFTVVKMRVSSDR